MSKIKFCNFAKFVDNKIKVSEISTKYSIYWSRRKVVKTLIRLEAKVGLFTN